MNEKLTKINLDAAGKGETRWDDLSELDNVQTSARALSDPDTILLDQTEIEAIAPSLAQKANTHFEIYKSKDGLFHWRLSSNDEIVAHGDLGYKTKGLARKAVLSFLNALGNVDDIAA